jgi:hypothetical protein
MAQGAHLASAMLMTPMWKNLISGTGPPFSFSITCGAVGP